MKTLLVLIAMVLTLPLSMAYSNDELNSHEKFETGPMPKIINYDPEFRPPMPMPQYESGTFPDDEPYESSTTYDIKIMEREIVE
jgi:hypothetical protein